MLCTVILSEVVLNWGFTLLSNRSTMYSLHFFLHFWPFSYCLKTYLCDVSFTVSLDGRYLLNLCLHGSFFRLFSLRKIFFFLGKECEGSVLFQFLSSAHYRYQSIISRFLACLFQSQLSVCCCLFNGIFLLLWLFIRIFFLFLISLVSCTIT